MADDITQVQSSLEEIKALLQNKKKGKSDGVSTEIFTDPRFIEIFQNYFKPLIESSKDIKDKLTDKKKISVFDVIGVSERMQDTKRDALTKELDKLTDKLRNIAKNLGNTRHYTLSDVIGLTKSERATNRRMVNNAVRALTLSINQTAKNLSDPKALMKFVGVKPNAGTKVSTNGVEAPVVIKDPTASSNGTAPAAPVVTPQKQSLAEREKAGATVVPVKVVAVSDEIAEMIGKIGGGGPVTADKGKGTGGDRESYSHSLNALARNTVIGLGLLMTGATAIYSGIFDQGPLKGVKKMVGTYSLQLAGKVGKTMLHYLGNLMPTTMKAIKEAFSGGMSATIAKRVVKSGTIAKAGARMIGFLGKVLKKLPGIGALISIGFAMNRFSHGDIQGGLIDLASGAASTIPIVGTAVSIGLDILNAQADIASGGVTPNKKGWLGKMNKYIAKWMGRLLYNSLKILPKGLRDKVAGWMGIPYEGLQTSVNSDEDGDEGKSSAAVNPAIASAQAKIENANAVKQKKSLEYSAIAKKAIAEGRAKMVTGGIAPSYDIQFTAEEQARIKSINETTAHVDKIISDAKASIQNASTAKAAEQKPTAGAENAQSNASEQDNTEDETPTVRVDRPTEQSSAHAVPVQNETVDELKRVNANLEQLATKANKTPDAASNGSITNVVSAQGGSSGGGNSSLHMVLDAVRDTCYTSREKSRNSILDYRALA